MSEWISVKDRVPDPFVDVITFSKSNGLSLNHRKRDYYGECEDIFNRYVWEDQGIHNSITHWMPLPESPEPTTEYGAASSLCHLRPGPDE